MPDLDLTSAEVKAAVEAAAKKLAAELVESETNGLKSSQRKLLEEKKALEARLKGLPEDFDPEKWAQLTEAEKKRAEDEAQKKGEWEKLKGDLLKQHETERTKLVTERDNAVKRYEDFFVQSELTAAIAKAEGIPDILMPRVRQATKLVRGENGDTVVVVNPDGSPRVNAKGEAIGVGTLLDELKADDIWSRGFKATGASGGGAGGSGNGQGGAKTMKRSVWNGLSAEQRAQTVRDGISIVD